MTPILANSSCMSPYHKVMKRSTYVLLSHLTMIMSFVVRSGTWNRFAHVSHVAIALHDFPSWEMDMNLGARPRAFVLPIMALQADEAPMIDTNHPNIGPFLWARVGSL